MEGPEMRDNEAKWHRRFLLLAEHIAQWSKDPSTKVGAVIVDENRRVMGLGYNGFPRGVEDSVDRYTDRKEKYPRVVHAELNAILNAVQRLGEEHTIYVTLPPCCECAKAIIQSGIGTVVLSRTIDAAAAERWEESMQITLDMFDEAGVFVEMV